MDQHLIYELYKIQDASPTQPMSPEAAALLMICRRLDALESTLSNMVREMQ